MAHDTSAPSSADAMAVSGGIAEAIDAVVAATALASGDVTGPRGPDPEMASTTAHLNEQWDEIRGRGAVYPVLYSGRGRGVLAEMVDGSVKYDFITGIGVHPFGHGDPDLIRAALQGATSSTLMEGNLQASPDAVAFSAALLGNTGSGSDLAHVFLCTSGALANETALKICMQKRSAAPRVIAFAHCFAGRTTTMSQIGDNAAARVGIALTQAVDYIPFFDPRDPEGSTTEACDVLAQHLKQYPQQHACIVAELVQGEGGVNVAPREFFVRLFEQCRQAAVPIWIDEIQTFGRTQELFAYQWLDLEEYVDVVTVGKLSQVCACLYTAKMNPKPGLLSGTFIGSAPAFRVGHRIIERLIEEGTFGDGGRNARLSAAFQQRCQALIDRRGEWFERVGVSDRPSCPGMSAYGGVGGMQRLTPFGGDPSAIKAAIKAVYERGVLCLQAGHGLLHMRFLLPFGVVTEEDLDGAFALIEAGLADVAKGRRSS
jgi:4-aminobutyrate aminotransferase-like enzyme